jgi:hypothetical protein
MSPSPRAQSLTNPLTDPCRQPNARPTSSCPTSEIAPLSLSPPSRGALADSSAVDPEPTDPRIDAGFGPALRWSRPLLTDPAWAGESERENDTAEGEQEREKEHEKEGESAGGKEKSRLPADAEEGPEVEMIEVGVSCPLHPLILGALSRHQNFTNLFAAL